MKTSSVFLILIQLKNLNKKLEKVMLIAYLQFVTRKIFDKKLSLFR